MPGKFFVAVGAFIDKGGKLLILKRSPKRDYEAGTWETVSGRLEQDVKEVKSELLREIKEELGEDFKCEIIAPFGTYNFYRGAKQAQEHIGIDYVCKYISGEIRLSREHTEYRWIDPEEFKNYSAPDSLKKKVKLFTKVKGWYLKNASFFRDHK